MMERIWHALTAFGTNFGYGAGEAWGFWSTSILFVLVILFLAVMLDGIFWRMIERRLKVRPIDKDMQEQYLKMLAERDLVIAEQTKELEEIHAYLDELEPLAKEKRNHDRAWAMRVKGAMKDYLTPRRGA